MHTNKTLKINMPTQAESKDAPESRMYMTVASHDEGRAKGPDELPDTSNEMKIIHPTKDDQCIRRSSSDLQTKIHKEENIFEPIFYYIGSVIREFTYTIDLSTFKRQRFHWYHIFHNHIELACNTYITNI